MTVMNLGREEQLMRQGGHQKRELTQGQDIAAAPRPPLQETLVLGHSHAGQVSSSK